MARNGSQLRLQTTTCPFPFLVAQKKINVTSSSSSHEGGEEVCPRRRKDTEMVFLWIHPGPNPRGSFPGTQTPHEGPLFYLECLERFKAESFCMRAFIHLLWIRSRPLTPGGLLKSPYVSDKQPAPLLGPGGGGDAALLCGHSTVDHMKNGLGICAQGAASLRFPLLFVNNVRT